MKDVVEELRIATEGAREAFRKIASAIIRWKRKRMKRKYSAGSKRGRRR